MAIRVEFPISPAPNLTSPPSPFTAAAVVAGSETTVTVGPWTNAGSTDLDLSNIQVTGPVDVTVTSAEFSSEGKDNAPSITVPAGGTASIAVGVTVAETTDPEGSFELDFEVASA